MSGLKQSMEYLQLEFNTSKNTKEAVSTAYSTYNVVTEAIIAKENEKQDKNNNVKGTLIDVEDIRKNTESIVIRNDGGER